MRFAIRNPGYVCKTVWRELTLADERFLSAITQRTPREIRRLFDEPSSTPKFLNHLRQAESVFRQATIVSADLYAKKALLQYAVVRALEPDVVVDTGVANGVSASYVLLALHKNGRGSLHSIDIGDASYLPAGKSTGWLIPHWLRERWSLHVGDSREALPPLLRRFSQIDVFIHDSLHTYEHMMFEFEQAYPRLRPGGVLIADDALWNPSFSEFSRSVGGRASVIRGVGVLQKP